MRFQVSLCSVHMYFLFHLWWHMSPCMGVHFLCFVFQWSLGVFVNSWSISLAIHVNVFCTLQVSVWIMFLFDSFWIGRTSCTLGSCASLTLSGYCCAWTSKLGFPGVDFFSNCRPLSESVAYLCGFVLSQLSHIDFLFSLGIAHLSKAHLKCAHCYIPCYLLHV